MATIRSIRATEIMDSRGDPTIQVEIETDAARATADVPSGASVGSHEAVELRDNDPESREGRGVSMAMAHIEGEISRALIGASFDQRELDRRLCELDGTPNKSRFGANAILPVSIAFSRAEAREKELPLYRHLGLLGRTTPKVPCLLFNVLNGGKHATGGIDIQECMLAPVGLSATSEQVQAATAVMASLQPLLGFGIEMGDEGGFAPPLPDNAKALDLLVEAIAGSGYTEGTIKLAIDVAASSLFQDGAYVLRGERKSREEMTAWYENLAHSYPLISIEDPFAEEDWDGFSMLTAALGKHVRIVGDDLTVTNVDRIEEAAMKKAVNACIVKPNQIGTVSEAIDAVLAARKAGWTVYASHRSGETMDTFIADFATGLACEFLKAGAPTKEERLVKYNRLMDIEKEMAAP